VLIFEIRTPLNQVRISVASRRMRSNHKKHFIYILREETLIYASIAQEVTPTPAKNVTLYKRNVSAG
jgi:hypothetical protein